MYAASLTVFQQLDVFCVTPPACPHFSATTILRYLFEFFNRPRDLKAVALQQLLAFTLGEMALTDNEEMLRSLCKR